MISQQSAFIEPQLKAIEGDREDAWFIKEILLGRVNVVIWIANDFHTFDGQYWFVCIKVDMLMECQLSIKYESQVFSSIIGLKNVAS